ncbi:MAG: amino acid ABC transporter ATP-binding protein [Bacillota bacterium]|jgi:polar amino acid transport system ATP-binding protein|nr:amino acid ABC transporter ATP-binding protein [Bacillota bacterium]HOB90522.1 amino acid ABC transporter ATP-binding protein [Bacillota bacterium]HPZ53738.1 amino acid ABC transporter ATP-binding protein [Bacillota bacterium]HQD17900.1 amino acid ABC transporter ATP-binding protein [Bacillota bacterium]
MLSVRGLSKRFDDKQVLDGVSFSVDKGETLVITGPSGSGKSTALRCINRLVEPDSGTILVGGLPICELDSDELVEARRKIGFVFQRFNLIERLTALENVALPLLARGVPKDDALIKAASALERVGLTADASKLPSEMSGGQQQRVGIARALVGDPEVMLWDEPTASLDPILAGEILDLMRELACEHGKTMVMVTHEVRFALEVADRVVLLESGRVVEQGTPQEVFLSPATALGTLYGRLVN